MTTLDGLLYCRWGCGRSFRHVGTWFEDTYFDCGQCDRGRLKADPITLDATEIVDLVTLKIGGPAVLFIRIEPEKMTDTYVRSIIEAMYEVMTPLAGRGMKYLIVPKDIDLAVVGEAQLEKLGLMRIPEPLIADGAVNESERSL